MHGSFNVCILVVGWLAGAMSLNKCWLILASSHKTCHSKPTLNFAKLLVYHPARQEVLRTGGHSLLLFCVMNYIKW